MIIRLNKQYEECELPWQSDPYGNVGFDIRSIDNIIVPAGRVAKINTGISFAYGTPSIELNCNNRYIEEDTDPNDSGTYQKLTNTFTFTSFFKIEGRSGLATTGLWPVGGIIDPSYRGPIIVALYNSTDQPYQIYTGDRIAQLVLYPVVANTYDEKIDFVWCDDHEESDRNSNGFGSTGR